VASVNIHLDVATVNIHLDVASVKSRVIGFICACVEGYLFCFLVAAEGCTVFSPVVCSIESAQAVEFVSTRK
jgi:hypothetical protein